MRNVNFIEIGMKNFGPYIDPMILAFENDKLVLLTGPNGIGKTLSLDALPFTLFGSTSKGARGDDVVNNVVGRNCHTWVKFSIDKDMYLVDRYHKYTKFGNTVIISKNGEEPYKKGQKEVLPEIEKLICPQKSFTNTLMFGQKVKDFFTDLVDSDKKEIFRKILNLNRYQLFYDKAKSILDELKESVLNLQNQLKVSKELIIDTDKQLEMLAQQKRDFFIKLENDKKELQKEIEGSKRILDSWSKKLDDLKKNQEDWEGIKSALEEIESQEKRIEIEIENLKKDLNSKKDLKISQLNIDASKAKEIIKDEAHKRGESHKDWFISINKKLIQQADSFIEEKNKIELDINTRNSAIDNASNTIDELKIGMSESTCPTCLQTITDTCKSILENKIIELEDEIKENKDEIEENLLSERKIIFKEIEEINKKKISAQEIMEVDIRDSDLIAKQQLSNADQKLNEAIEKVEQLSEEHLQAIKENFQERLKPIYNAKEKLLVEAKKHQSLELEIKEYESTVNTLERAITQKKIELESKEEQVFDQSQIFFYEKKKRDQIINANELNLKLEDSKEDQEMFEFWKSAFSTSGIPSMLIDEAVPFMNRKVAQYLDKLTNGRYIVSFDTLAETKAGEFRDKISVNVLDTHTRASSRIQLSGGQTRIIDIATILTLGDLQSNIQEVSFNILLFDEIFDSLDEENIGFVSKVLSNMKVGKSIYLISHRHEDQLEADTILTLN